MDVASLDATEERMSHWLSLIKPVQIGKWERPNEEEDIKMDACFEERLCEKIRRHPHLYNSTPGAKSRKRLEEMKMPAVKSGNIYETDM